jgi:hypothetical protein
VAAPVFQVAATGAIRGGTAAAPVFTASATGAVHAEGDLTLGPVAAPLVDIGIDGAVRLGTAAAPTVSITTAGAPHFEGALTVGPAAAPLHGLAVDGSEVWGAVAAPVATLSAAGAFACDEDVNIGPTGAALIHLDADGSQRWGASGAATATMSTAGALATDGAITTDSTVEGLTLDGATGVADITGAVRYVRARLTCTGGEVCDQADSPILFGPTLPQGAYLHWCMIDVTAVFTSDTMPADGAVLALGIVGDESGIHAGVTHAEAAYDGVPVWTVATAVGPLGAAAQLAATVTVDNVAAGVLDVICAYSVL